MTGWRQRLQALGGRLAGPAPPAQGPKAAIPSATPAPGVPRPAAASPPPARPAPAGGVVIVTVLGLEGETLEPVLDLVEGECRRLGRKPVLVTDGFDLAPFRRRRLVVEQVPDAEAMALLAPDLPWSHYRERLFTLLARRWRPTATVSFGRRPEPACLQAIERR